MVEMVALSSRLRKYMVDLLQQSGVLHSPSMRNALLNVPREVFVPRFYEQDASSQRLAWTLLDLQSSPEDYLRKVYRNQSLITQIDERSWPISSSSLPSVMTKMLEALDVHPQQRVLEIGTGTGYNAALLSCLTENTHCITTIERDKVLAKNAAAVLGQIIGQGITIIVGDGFWGWEQGMPYGRIIATASAPTLPMAWVRQLATGGRLVMDLRGSLDASGFLVVEKTMEGAIGHFFSEPLHFMPLVTESLPFMRVPKVADLLQTTCSETESLLPDHLFPSIFSNDAFRWFLQWRIPGCQISQRTQLQRESGVKIRDVFVIESHKALLRFQQEGEEGLWHMKAYNSSTFWREIQRAYEDFQLLGTPSRDRYVLSVRKNVAFLEIGSFIFPLNQLEGWGDSSVSIFM